MHEPQASALCNQVHYCIIRVCHIKRRKLSWACHNCFIAGHGTLPFYRCGLISKSAIATYCTLKCTLSDLMHCFRSIWLVGCHVTSNKFRIMKVTRYIMQGFASWLSVCMQNR